MRSQRIGHGFESRYLHHKQRKSNRLVRLFSCLRRGYKGHLTRGACYACRHAARDRANGLIISASISRQRSLKGESRYLHHIEQAGFFVQPVFVYVLYGGDIRDVSPVGHATHAATLHARADESMYKTRAFRVRSLKGESRYLHHANGSVFTGPFFISAWWR